ncbi:MAG: orotidine-5'-phosphate decarboxylase [Actinomycetia bacterium]|nr:orotidine-5'-phosphate decarboxylase [Actinomycetes bacterium]
MTDLGAGSSFGARLDAALTARGSLCVGIDPHPGLLTAWGLPVDVSGLERFALTVVSALAGEVAALKPQSAFFERFGSAGIAVLERTVAAGRELGALVVLDVKRGDIGSTMDAYAAAYLGPAAAVAADAITVSPYLGVGALNPAFAAASAGGQGVFVLARTSNPEGVPLQQARLADGRAVAQAVVDEVGARNAGAAPLGSFGVVVGATIGASGLDLAGLNGPFLVPGVGAQGGTADDVRRIFGGARRAVLPATSREVLGRGPDVTALRGAARRKVEEFAFLRA